MEKFRLKWNDFHSNVSKSFGLLRSEEYLHDVRLMSEDYQEVSAHKLVLSASSEYFRNIFKNSKKQDTLISRWNKLSYFRVKLTRIKFELYTELDLDQT